MNSGIRLIIMSVPAQSLNCNIVVEEIPPQCRLRANADPTHGATPY